MWACSMCATSMSRSRRNKGVGVRQRFELGKQQPQVGLELRAGHLPVDLAPGGELKDKHQQPVEQQHCELVPTPARIAQIGDLPQPFKQTGQLAAENPHLPAHRLLARLPLLGHGSVG